MNRLIIISAIIAITATWANVSYASDPRIVTIALSHQRLAHLDTSVQTQQTLLMPPGERIASVLLSNQAAYRIAVSPTGDSLTLRATHSRAIAVMTVKTEQQEHTFQLVPMMEGKPPAVFMLTTNQEAHKAMPVHAADIAPSSRRAWKVKGDKSVQPHTVLDDGERTYIEWASDQALPATFAVNRTGGEEIVNGHMRFGMYTIDRVFDRLVFRFDNASASAEPEPERSRGRERD